MNHNCLIIAANGSAARLFRVAETNDDARPVELIEVGAVTALGEGADASTRPSSTSQASQRNERLRETVSHEELGVLARRVAERAAEYGAHHYCNPVFVLASHALWPVISDEVERQLPNAHVRPVYGDVTGLAPQQVLERLQKHEAFG